MQQTTVAQVAALNFAYGKVGQRFPITSSEASNDFARKCSEQTHELTVFSTADCGDERVTVALGNGVTDRNVLDARVVPQLFGGIVLAATKACVAANAVALRDAKDFTEATQLMEELLGSLGYKNAGHQGCGANNNVRLSVEHQLAQEKLVPAIGLLVADDGFNTEFVADMASRKQLLVLDGFFDNWQPARYEKHVRDTTPENFSILAEGEPEDELHGHNGSGLYVVTRPGQGYVKDGSAFSVTLPFMQTLADKLGGSDEERRRILLGFADDTLHVGSGIVAEGFPVFAQAA